MADFKSEQLREEFQKRKWDIIGMLNEFTSEGLHDFGYSPEEVTWEETIGWMDDVQTTLRALMAHRGKWC